MFSTADTIVAIATPPGRGGLGVVRISGPRARDVAQALLTRRHPLEPRRAAFSHLRETGPASDQVVATFFPAPGSYTGQDVVEISAHGSPVILRGIVQAAIGAGARLAQPGEFTLRAFLEGKLDLVQAEAVGDLIAAATPLQARVAFDQLEGTLTRRITDIDEPLFDLIARLEASLDFPDEGYHFVEPADVARQIGCALERIDALLAHERQGRMIREGAAVVIAGRTNVGKSSIFNVLAGNDRAIVTSVPGTTRDLVTEPVEIDGLAVTLVDTAGLRDTLDVVEREGVSRGAQARQVADLTLVVIDGSEAMTPDDDAILAETSPSPRVVVANKVDLVQQVTIEGALRVSAKTGEGVAELRQAIARALTGGEALRDPAPVTNLRHADLLRQARAHLRRAREAAEGAQVPEEFLLSDLQAARACFDEVVGVRTSDDVLRHIFDRFCIGK